MGYWIGLVGMWLVCDGIFSLSVTHRYFNSGNIKQSWLYDHSIRIIRVLLGIFLIIAGKLAS